MIDTCRDKWLQKFYFDGGKRPAEIPKEIEVALLRKLTILHVAASEQDLMVPPGNCFEHLEGKLKDWCSVRVNIKYRLIFQWDTGKATGVYLDPHKYGK